VSRLRPLLGAGAAAVMVSGYIHYYLYFHGGYRGIHPDRVLGLDISRAFALQAVAAVVVAAALVLALRVTALQVPAAIVGLLFAVGAISAYVMVRTSGLLGFTDDRTTVEALIALIAEAVAALALGAYLAARSSVRADGLRVHPG
jgi:hypothetical protein